MRDSRRVRQLLHTGYGDPAPTEEFRSRISAMLSAGPDGASPPAPVPRRRIGVPVLAAASVAALLGVAATTLAMVSSSNDQDPVGAVTSSGTTLPVTTPDASDTATSTSQDGDRPPPPSVLVTQSDRPVYVSEILPNPGCGMRVDDLPLVSDRIEVTAQFPEEIHPWDSIAEFEVTNLTDSRLLANAWIVVYTSDDVVVGYSTPSLQMDGGLMPAHGSITLERVLHHATDCSSGARLPSGEYVAYAMQSALTVHGHSPVIFVSAGDGPHLVVITE